MRSGIDEDGEEDDRSGHHLLEVDVHLQVDEAGRTIICTSSTPMTVPGKTLPTPPKRLVPPRTAAAMALNRCPGRSPAETLPC